MDKQYTNRIRWARKGNQTALPEVDEGRGWVPYQQSKLYVPDSPIMSKGYLTFNRCLENGYEICGLHEY